MKKFFVSIIMAFMMSFSFVAQATPSDEDMQKYENHCKRYALGSDIEKGDSLVVVKDAHSFREIHIAEGSISLDVEMNKKKIKNSDDREELRALYRKCMRHAASGGSYGLAQNIMYIQGEWQEKQTWNQWFWNLFGY